MTVHLGVVFPQTEIGADPLAIRDYTQAVEDIGFDYLMAYDHVLGANPERPGGWRGPYTFRDTFHEPLTLYAWLAGLTRRLEFVTGILILPQRQTALVAKQAAQVSLVSGGRLRLGVGIGWNAVEFSALGQNFHRRGRRLEEQVILLRRLWTEPLVTHVGVEESIADAGLNPLPPEPIPIWFGGDADVALRRMARLGDGWIPNWMPMERLQTTLATLRGYIADEERNPAQFGIDVRIHVTRTPEADWRREAEQLAAMGVTHLCINTMGAGYTRLDQHLDTVRCFKAALSA